MQLETFQNLELYHLSRTDGLIPLALRDIPRSPGAPRLLVGFPSQYWDVPNNLGLLPRYVETPVSLMGTSHHVWDVPIFRWNNPYQMRECPREACHFPDTETCSHFTGSTSPHQTGKSQLKLFGYHIFVRIVRNTLCDQMTQCNDRLEYNETLCLRHVSCPPILDHSTRLGV